GDAPRFDSPEFAWAHSDEDYRQAIGIDRLRREDVIAYVSSFRPALGKIAPDAGRYVVRKEACDETHAKKIQRLLGSAPDESVTLFALYPGNGAAMPLANTPRALEVATRDRRLGYVAVARSVHGPAPELWLRLDNDWRISKVMPRNTHAQALA